jgi:hypothetical protein
MLFILIISAYFGTYYIGHPSMKQVRDMTIEYIKAHHSETVQYMENFTWIGGSTNFWETGAASYSYQSTGWNMTIQHGTRGSSIVALLWPTNYKVTATYTAQATPEKVIILWQGTLQNGIIIQTAYTFNP